MLRKMLRVLMGASIAGALVVSVGTQASAAVDASRPNRTVLGVGSDTTYEGMNDLDQLYNESPGCAIIPDVGVSFTNYQQKCDASGILSYGGDLIQSENLYHDRVTEAFPVGSGNGATVLLQYTQGNPALAADFTRSSSKRDLTNVAGFNDYGVAFARDGLGYWLGKTNKLVKTNKAGPLSNISVADLKGVFIGNGSGQCLNTYSTNATDSVAATLGNPGTGNIKVFATQPGSGTGKDFLGKIDTSTSYSNALALQNCIGASFKDSAPNPSDHVIFENNAKPICQMTGSGGAAVSYQSTAIFPYSFARFTQNAGSVGACAGRIGKVGGVAANLTTIGDGSYALGRFVYNNFYVPNAQDVNDDTTWAGQTEAMLDYLHPVTGWLCQQTHAVDPNTGLNYRTLIENAMKADGFAPLSLGNVGGTAFTGTSYCRDGAST